MVYDAEGNVLSGMDDETESPVSGKSAELTDDNSADTIEKAEAPVISERPYKNKEGDTRKIENLFRR